MNNTEMTVVYFDNGKYSEENKVQWIRKGKIMTLVMKKSIDDVTYVGLVERIRMKMGIDEATKKLDMSYIPLIVDCDEPIYMVDDDDVLGYLTSFKDQCRSLLHVELVHVEENQQNEWYEDDGDGAILRREDDGDGAMVRREDEGNGIYVDNEELLSSARGNNYGTVALDEGGGNDFHSTTMASEENYEIATDNEIDDIEERDDIEAATESQEDYVGGEWNDGMDLTLGQEFETKEEVQDIVEKMAHMNCFEFAIMKSDRKRYVLKCSEWRNGCKWGLRVAKLKNSDCFSIRTYYKMHACSRASTSTSENRRKGTARLVASILHEDYPGRFDTPTAKSLIGIVQGRLGMKVSYSTAMRGKKRAANEVRGSPEKSYMMLYSYLYMLEKMNPNTISRVELDEKHRFKYLFFALGACIEGFKAMRKVLIVDGTHLKTKPGGVLIVVTAQDPNHHHYPIAFGVVDGEKDASWGWFFSTLKGVIPDMPGLVFITDRNQSLIKAIREVFPLSQHGYCNFHLSQNVKSQCAGVRKESVAAKFRECSKAYTECEFLTLYDAFRKKYPAAGKYLDDSVVEARWARCYFPGDRYNIDSSNCVESINGVFLNARKYALLPMIDAIVEKLGEWFNKHRRSAVDVPETQKLVPYVESIIHTSCAEAKLLTVHELNCYHLQFTVIGLDGHTYSVDLRMKTCTCKHFDIDKYPCVHAIAASMNAGINLHELCSNYYFVEVWASAYHETIYHVPHISQWVVPDEITALYALPPPCVKRKGRRKVTRIPSVGEYPRRRKGVQSQLESIGSRC